jgi:hypothetical protein
VFGARAGTAAAEFARGSDAGREGPVVEQAAAERARIE